jgi:ADP-heptose:LPS heptosyltransferase
VRFSALGDVAMLVPVLHSVLKQNPKLNITFISRPMFAPLFNFSNRLTFIGVELDKKHKGLFGLKKLSNELIKNNKFDAIVDVHDVLRTQILRTFFKMKGVKAVVFDKGRKEKKELLKGTSFNPLKHSTNRYAETFEKLGLKSKIINETWIAKANAKKTEAILHKINLSKEDQLIGIAPFAKHKSKEWSLEKIDELIKTIGKNYPHKIVLFGGGDKERKHLEKLAKKHAHCVTVVGKLTFEEELSLIGNLKAMVSMDSANMHLAVVCSTPVISIWGPTHHYAGFGPLNNEHNIVEVSKEKLPCRPCTVYGKIKDKKAEKCAEKSMEMITVDMVLDKLIPLLK